MATLVEREKILTKQAGELDQLAAHVANLAILRTRTKALDERTKEIAKTAGGVALLSKHKVKISNVPTSSKELRSQPNKFKTDLASDWVAVVRNEEINTTFLSPLEAYTKRLGDSVLLVWRQHIDDLAPKINDA